MLLDTMGLIGDRERVHKFSLKEKLIISGVMIIVCIVFFCSAGLLPGISGTF